MIRHLFTRLSTALAVLLAALSFQSCHHKDLYFPEPQLTSRLYVKFEWSKAPDAAPESMGAYLFDETGANPLRFIFDNKDGGEIKAPCGKRHILFLNADNTSWLRMRKNHRIEEMELLTLDATDLSAQSLVSTSVPRANDASSTERVASTPGMLWGGRSDNHIIRAHVGTDTITLSPEELVCHYTVDIYDVENVNSLTYSSIDATISGMAEGYGLGAGCATDNIVTMPFVLSVDKEAASMHSEFLTFGECPHTSVSHNLTVYMLLNDGSKWYHTFDVSSQVSNAPDPRHVHIIIRGLPLPNAPTIPSSVIVPDVNEWQAVHVKLPMNLDRR